MNNEGKDVTKTLTGQVLKSSTGNLNVGLNTNITGVEAKIEQSEFNHAKEIHSEREKSWFTALNIFIAVCLAIAGFYLSPIFGGVVGVASCLVLIIGSKYAKEKRKDVTISYH